MILRQYLYIDEAFVDNSFAMIHGYDYDLQEIQRQGTTESYEGDGTSAHKETHETATEINAKMTLSAKLQVVIDYLQKNAQGGIPFYDSMSKDELAALKREQFIEGQFILSFTKIEQYGRFAESVQKIGSLISNHNMNEIEGIEEIQKLAKQERERGTPCILTFANGKNPSCFAYLDEQYIKTKRIHSMSEITILAKVVRIIKQGQHVCLTDLSDLMNERFPKTTAGKKARVEAIKNGQMAKLKELEDRIDGPALELLPIAIYR